MPRLDLDALERAERAADAAKRLIDQAIAYKPREIVMDEFAYKRMVNNYRDALRAIRSALVREQGGTET